MKKRDDWKKNNEKWFFMKWSLVKITLKHNLGLLILSFGIPNPGLHYVPRKSILIERGYLDWRVFFLEKFFLINKAVVSFPQPTKNLDQSFTCSWWILNYQVHNRTVKKKYDKRMKMERKNDSRVKTRKGSLEQTTRKFLKFHGRSKQKNERAMTEQHLNPLWGLLPSPKPKVWTPRSKMPSSSLSWWVLMLVKLPYSGTTKMNLFKMLDFQRIHFFQKKALELHRLLA